MPYLVCVDFSVAGTAFRYWLAPGGTWTHLRWQAHPINTRSRADIVRRRLVSLARQGEAEDGTVLPDKVRDKGRDRYSIVPA